MRLSRSIVGLMLFGAFALAMTWYFSRDGRIAPARQAAIAIEKSRAASSAALANTIKPARATPLSKMLPRGRKAFSISTSIPDYEGSAKAHVEALLPASKAGDAAASYEIYLRVRSCRLALRPLMEDELAIDRELGIDQQMLGRRERELDQCDTLISSPELLDGRWLDIAAEQGALEARLIYATDPAEILGESSQMLAAPERVIAYRERAISYMQDALRQGNLNALSILSSAYENGILIKRDPVMSYAYAAALVRADPNPASADLESIPRQALTEVQLRQGREMAEAIYSQCCSQTEVSVR